ncbi:MAG: DUF5683 domain-containing protein [Ferruginibacter sp.]
MFFKKKLLLFSLLFFGYHFSNAQKDSAVVDTALNSKINTPDTVKKYSPKIAIVRSAMIPGWGQITNKKYWKVPIVYGALGTTAALFFRNLKQYRESKEAYKLATDNDPSNDSLIKQPYFTVRNQPERIRSFRNSVRQNVDYTVLFFVVFWGLNVADAAVDAHLKTFDVNDDLSLQIKAGYSPLARTNGISLVLNIGK